jgi:hypothetical protein
MQFVSQLEGKFFGFRLSIAVDILSYYHNFPDNRIDFLCPAQVKSKQQQQSTPGQRQSVYHQAEIRFQSTIGQALSST